MNCSDLALEGDPQSEFNLARGTEGVDARSYADAIYVVSVRSGAVDLSGSSREKTIERVARQSRSSQS